MNFKKIEQSHKKKKNDFIVKGRIVPLGIWRRIPLHPVEYFSFSQEQWTWQGTRLMMMMMMMMEEEEEEEEEEDKKKNKTNEVSKKKSITRDFNFTEGLNFSCFPFVTAYETFITAMIENNNLLLSEVLPNI